MKILLLCKKFPYPLKDGESIAVHTLSLALSQLGCEVSLLAMNTRKHFYQEAELPQQAAHFARIRTVPIDNRIKPSAAFLNLFSNESYHIARFVSPAYEQALQEMLQEVQYDVVQLETLYLAPYVSTIRRHSQARISMRAHNVEHEIWERISSHTGNVVKRWYLKHLTGKLKQYEVRSLEQYDMLLPITERDLRYFRKLGYKKPAIVTPIGIRAQEFPEARPLTTAKPSISFIGSLDWMPNIEGLHWFIQKVWPTIHQRFPELEFHIAGRNTPASLLQLKRPNVFVHGEVPESAPFIDKHCMMVVPLLSGSGMRAKILEGMALGKVVLSTSIGLEGISATHKKDVMVANTVDQYVDAVAYTLRSNEQLNQMAQQAQNFVFEQYASVNIAKRVMQAYSSQFAESV
ncbi:MAG: glycosyltransferase family 4 protein [Bacteroidota bacterium]